MKFSPIDRHLYADSGALIKKLDCPHVLRRTDLSPETAGTDERCGRCERVVVDTAKRSDEELLALLEAEPTTCLKLDLNQSNLRVVIRHEPFRDK